ncbi:DUF3037 domain-containing protein [Moheibacter lacus]|uniref:DUF3037 domain-containing protein n=1 Tax=Moheibacter lacus TaxID=2745851 RepID=A0A838ZS03_9FLAO|nr:DUF3037 domain-containing protein [Moheibacter lacus]MBA5629772.1 DUF3037 domain-containing protein [Moheibacter lacus]
MQDKILYEYAVIRIFPKVEREEFINAGILIYSKQAKKLLVKTYFNAKKFAAFETELDPEQVQLNLKSFESIANADSNGGPISKMDAPSRFRWMTAVRSSCVQTSRPHPGFTEDLEKTLERLFEELVV